MKFALALLFCVVAAVSASGYYDGGFDKPENYARERKVNYVNGARQANVNHIAESVHASSGTYRRDGVPGTGVGGYAYGGNRAYGGYNVYPGNYAGNAKYAYPGAYGGSRSYF